MAADNRTDTRDYEVMQGPREGEMVCACGLFSFEGYSCRQAVSVLNQSGVEEIPSQYILSWWRKDINRSYVLNNG